MEINGFNLLQNIGIFEQKEQILLMVPNLFNLEKEEKVKQLKKKKNRK